MKIDKILKSNNIAEDLDEDLLMKIGDQVVSGYETDLDSRAPWEEDLKNWTELALQVSTNKTYPWPNAANIKFPLLATAAMQFAARAYPTLVPSNGDVVKCKVIGYDPTGEKSARAERVSKHMSYQVMDEMEEWEEDMDRLLLSLPIAGTCFKKTYFDSAKQRNVSKLILPKTLVVNYFCKSLEDAERITEVILLSPRQVKERVNRKLFLDIPLGTPPTTSEDVTKSINNAFQHANDEDNTTPYTILEQHTFLDLDNDGYSEPYIVTVEEATKKVLRIVPRFNEDTVQMSEDNNGKIVAIDPIQYYTKYSFIPNPDGGFYDIGFGRLLGPLNNSANTIINQLVDAGSLSNLQAGFIGKGLRIKMGESRFQPGEWKAVNAIGDDLKKQIFPLPVREPSDVLFKLLDLLLKSGKELASVAEIFVGKMPGQNTPATTTMATIEQGMKVFTAVYKRIYRALTKEFKKLYNLNKTYLDPETYISAIDIKVPQSDYKYPDGDIIPAADPNAVSSQEKQQRVQALMQIIQLGTINPMAVTQLYLEAHDIPEPEKYLMQPQPKQDPKVQALEKKSQIDAQKAQMDMAMSAEKLKMEQMSKEQELAHKAKLQDMELRGKQVEASLEGQKALLDMQVGRAQHQQQMQQQADQHRMAMTTAHQSHQAQMQHQQEANKQKLAVSKEKPKSGSNHK